MRVAAVKTPWAKAWDHHAICVNMDAILRAAGVAEEHVRRRMTAHAIVASGWRQACLNHNIWKVKLGGWKGDYFQSDTEEEVGGVLVPEIGTKWRSYTSWAQAFADYPVGTMSRYAKSHTVLHDQDALDSEFWAQLGRDGYYTDTQQMTPGKFASLCRRVKREVAEGGGVIGESLVLLGIAAVVLFLALLLGR